MIWLLALLLAAPPARKVPAQTPRAAFEQISKKAVAAREGGRDQEAIAL